MAKKLAITILLLISTAVSFAFVSSARAQPPTRDRDPSPSHHHPAKDRASSSGTTDTVVSSTCSSSATTTSTSLCSSSSSSSDNSIMTSIPKWFQHEISITAPSRGCHLITSEVNKAISSDLSGIKIGMANLFIQHTSASLTINENADPDVRR